MRTHTINETLPNWALSASTARDRREISVTAGQLGCLGDRSPAHSPELVGVDHQALSRRARDALGLHVGAGLALSFDATPIVARQRSPGVPHRTATRRAGRNRRCRRGRRRTRGRRWARRARCGLADLVRWGGLRIVAVAAGGKGQHQEGDRSATAKKFTHAQSVGGSEPGTVWRGGSPMSHFFSGAVRSGSTVRTVAFCP